MAKKIFLTILLFVLAVGCLTYDTTLAAGRKNIGEIGKTVNNARNIIKTSIPALFNSGTIKQRIQIIKEKRERIRQRLQERLNTIRAEWKKKIVLRINDSMANLNDRLTEHFSNVLDKLSRVLDRIANRIDKAESRGIDVSSARSAVDNARKGIALARDKVNEQAGKTYEITITNETGLRKDVKNARDALHNDLSALRDVIFSARDAVRNAAVSLAKVIRKNRPINNNSAASVVATSSASSTK